MGYVTAGLFSEKEIPSKGKFTDKRDREWEWFIDECYFGCTCVRPVGDRNFGSEMSFHFDTLKRAAKFIELLKEAM
jgi:hypothetical protein